jgi:hypothetical protein
MTGRHGKPVRSERPRDTDDRKPASFCARIVLAIFLGLLPLPASTLGQCCGDCDGRGAVEIAELITGVGNALHGCRTGTCCGDCNGDRIVSINELIAAVGLALNGCFGATPAATATATATHGESASETAAATATETPTPIRAVDNGDGTITDLSTALVWEKKTGGDGVQDGSNLHDADNRHPWQGRCRSSPGSCRDDADCPDDSCFGSDQQGTALTIFMWVERLNSQAFAKFADWRVPTASELGSLRDLDEIPAVDPAFHHDRCGTSCLDLGDPECSCTAPAPYWTSTADPSDDSRAWRIDFDDGAIVSGRKLDDLRVRAVRGP